MQILYYLVLQMQIPCYLVLNVLISYYVVLCMQSGNENRNVGR